MRETTETVAYSNMYKYLSQYNSNSKIKLPPAQQSFADSHKVCADSPLKPQKENKRSHKSVTVTISGALLVQWSGGPAPPGFLVELPGFRAIEKMIRVSCLRIFDFPPGEAPAPPVFGF
jgi:hypothetical protein